MFSFFLEASGTLNFFDKEGSALANLTFNDVKEIKSTVYQNTLAHVLSLVGIAGFVYLVAFDDVNWVYDKYIAGAFIVVVIIMNILAFSTGKEIENFLLQNPDVAKALEKG